MLHEDFQSKLGETWRTHFETILEEKHVVGSLNELDGLVEDARRRKKAGGEVPVP